MEDGKDWHDARVRERGPFQLDPATAVLHYAQEIFEGLKAYRTDQGSITLFRPEENARRFQSSAKRMAMPVMPEELFISAIEELARIDREWVPSGEGSLYLRPFMFATEVFLGVRPSSKYTFCVIASPVGAYFKGGEKPITVWISDTFSRAAPVGRGQRNAVETMPPVFSPRRRRQRRDVIRSYSWMPQNTFGSKNLEE